MAFMVKEGYFNIGLTSVEGNSHHSELLKQLLKFGLDHFLIPNHGNSILSSYSGSVYFQDIFPQLKLMVPSFLKFFQFS